MGAMVTCSRSVDDWRMMGGRRDALDDGGLVVRIIVGPDRDDVDDERERLERISSTSSSSSSSESVTIPELSST